MRRAAWLGWGLGMALLAVACRGEHEGPGEVTPERVARAAVALRAERQALGPGDKQILFGDLHVHTTFSADAFALSLPLMGGEGARPPADACDFARFCADLDFWSINDHAENLSPQHWRESVEAVRECNAVARDPADPDVVAFLGWEWSQVGDAPENHYGHKNVVLRDLEPEQVPARPIAAPRPEFKGVAIPGLGRWLMLLRDFPNRQRYLDQQTYLEEIQGTPYCPMGTEIDVRELPTDCLEVARTPRELFAKLDQWDVPSLVIPHGTTWGLMTPANADFALQLDAGQHDPARQRLFEIYSGHGNAEQYRAYRAVSFDAQGGPVCPEPSAAYLPCCWRAGEIIRSRCGDVPADECERRVTEARQNFVDAGAAGYRTVPGAREADWLDCGECRDCFAGAMDHRPGASAQYVLAAQGKAEGGDARFRFGLIGSSDTHRARAGNGYKELARRRNTDASGGFARLYGADPDPGPESTPLVLNDVPLQMRRYTERQASYYLTGGLVAVHSSGRDRRSIWEALQRREVYGTSGERILLYFELLNGPEGQLPMGAEVNLAESPRFRATALGAFEQRPGCPEHVEGALGAERLRQLCVGECYHPGDVRKRIDRLEVVRIRPRRQAGEPLTTLIEDPWRSFDCAPGPAGCSAEFEDEEFAESGREAVYYVRAVQEATPAINGAGVRCRYDAQGRCVEVDPCYGDERTPADDDCLADLEERAWSSPIFVGQRPAPPLDSASSDAE